MNTLVKFLQAVHLSGKDYAKGSSHPVTDEMIAHPFFHKMVKAGLIVETEASKVITPESLQERQERLAEMLLSKKPAAPAKVEGAGDGLPKAEGSEESHEAAGEEVSDVESEEAESEQKDHSAKNKNKKKR